MCKSYNTMSEKTRNKNLFKIVLYKSRKVWSEPCLPLYLRNEIMKSSLESGDYVVSLIKRNINEEKWKCIKKFNNDNTFIILDIVNNKKRKRNIPTGDIDVGDDDLDLEWEIKEMDFIDDFKNILNKHKEFILKIII